MCTTTAISEPMATRYTGTAQSCTFIAQVRVGLMFVIVVEVLLLNASQPLHLAWMNGFLKSPPRRAERRRWFVFVFRS